MILKMKDDYLDILNLMGKGYISKEPYDYIVSLCLRSSRGPTRKKDLARGAFARIRKLPNGGLTRA